MRYSVSEKLPKLLLRLVLNCPGNQQNKHQYNHAQRCKNPDKGNRTIAREQVVEIEHGQIIDQQYKSKSKKGINKIFHEKINCKH